MNVIEQICEKTGKPKEEVSKDYEVKRQEVKRTFPKLSEEEVTKRTDLKILSFYKKLLMSNSSEFEGYIFGYDDLTDRLSNKKEKAKQAFKENSIKAIKEGICDENGTPLETNSERKTFGKPIGTFIARNIYGVAMSKGKSPKTFVMTYTGSKTDEIKQPLVHQYVKFRARIREEKESQLILDSVPETTFDKYEKEGVPQITTVIEKFYKKLDDFENVSQGSDVVFESMVDSLDLENNFGTKRMIVSLEGADFTTPPVNVYMPKQFKFEDVEGLAEQTKVLIWGRLGGQKEDGTRMVNGYGIWVPLEWRSSKPPIIEKEDVENKDTW